MLVLEAQQANETFFLSLSGDWRGAAAPAALCAGCCCIAALWHASQLPRWLPNTLLLLLLLAAAGVLAPIIQSLQPSRAPEVGAIVADVWPLLCHSMALDPASLTEQQVLEAAQTALAAIERVVASPGAPNRGGGGRSSSSDNEDADHAAAMQPVQGVSAVEAKLEEFVARQERWASRVKPQAIPEQHTQVSSS